ncbi:hypothetical protein CSA08_01760 [Candidatus Gracilibacteria bacterium]|nr:MAG: hypothetical protein CSA08_01760 [Candidatus Gracilibacteria bacterium]
MYNKSFKNNLLAFGIVEILISILIFSLGLASIYLIIVSTLKLSDYNKNYIIASNLAREQLDLLRNLRDSNYNSVYKWNYIPNSASDFTKVFTGGYYKIENDFTPGAFYPIKIEAITSFGEGESELNNKMQSYKLCMDSNNNYSYDCLTSGNKDTKFFKFIKVEKLQYKSGGIDIIIDDAFKVTSKVIWNIRGYNEIEINTVIADWKRL